MQNDELKNRITELAQTLLKLRSVSEIKSFMEDLLTNAEQKSIATRLTIAQMLSDGISYSQIQRETGASSATIAKVSDNLKYGQDGFKLAIDRINKHK